MQAPLSKWAKNTSYRRNIYIWEYIGYTSVYTRDLFQEISLSISAKSLTFGR